MKFPVDFLLGGLNIILIPYKKEHVLKYHGWMEDNEILRLTGSERLTLEEEFDMQMHWEHDEKSTTHCECTFIIVDKNKFQETENEIDSIVGDTNLFLGEGDEGNDDDCAEIEIMIAEKWARRRGLAKEAVRMMMEFGHAELKKNKYTAKVKTDNTASIELFWKLGFRKVSESEVFNEITMEVLYK